MTGKRTQLGTLSRRSLIGGAAALGSVGLTKVAVGRDSNLDNLPPNVSEWTQYLGDGVDANPYGVPSPFEGHVIRRNVEWLTASTESSVNFTPRFMSLRALSRRTGSASSGIMAVFLR